MLHPMISSGKDAEKTSLLLGRMFCECLWGPFTLGCNLALQFLHLIFCLDDLPIAKSGMLKFSNMYWSWSLPSELLTFALYTSMLWSSVCVYLEWLSPVAEMAPMLLYNDLPWKSPFAMFYLKSMATAMVFFFFILFV